jgi:1,4-dihydroxy-2-naphthoate octaprenyltransferase
MGRRRQANRAEAIVRGVGAIVMLLLLLIMVQVLPQILKGRDPREMVNTMTQMVLGFAVVGGLVVVIGLVVWLKVIKRK